MNLAFWYESTMGFVPSCVRVMSISAHSSKKSAWSITSNALRLPPALASAESVPVLPRSGEREEK